MEDIQQPISGLLVSTLLFNNKSTPNLESKEPSNSVGDIKVLWSTSITAAIFRFKFWNSQS